MPENIQIMLSIGVHLITTDYNRKSVLVHHLLDDVTGKPLPICGADLELHSDGDAADFVEAIQRGDEPISNDDSERMCGRCKRICLSPGSEEEKSTKRLKRWNRKQAKLKVIETYEQEIIAQQLDRCPKCRSLLNAREPLGYEDHHANCDGCFLEWTFGILARADGTFTVFADDASEQHSGRAQGQVGLKEMVWKWD